MSLNNPIALECTWEFPIRNHFLPLQASKYLFLSWMQLNLSFLSGRTMHCTTWSLQITQDKRKSTALLLFSSERKTSSGGFQHLQWDWSPLLIDSTCIRLTQITWNPWECLQLSHYQGFWHMALNCEGLRSIFSLTLGCKNFWLNAYQLSCQGLQDYSLHWTILLFRIICIFSWPY